MTSPTPCRLYAALPSSRRPPQHHRHTPSLGPSSDPAAQFSATYVPLQPLSVLAARKVGPRWWMGFLLLAWGSICMGHAGISSTAHLVALRVLLGAAESGFTQTA